MDWRARAEKLAASFTAEEWGLLHDALHAANLAWRKRGERGERVAKLVRLNERLREALCGDAAAGDAWRLPARIRWQLEEWAGGLGCREAHALAVALGVAQRGPEGEEVQRRCLREMGARLAAILAPVAVRRDGVAVGFDGEAQCDTAR